MLTIFRELFYKPNRKFTAILEGCFDINFSEKKIPAMRPEVHVYGRTTDVGDASSETITAMPSE